LHAIAKANEVRSVAVIDRYRDQYTRAAGVWRSKTSLYAYALSDFKRARITIFNEHTFTAGWLDPFGAMKV
jgi:hypothetical protein